MTLTGYKKVCGKSYSGVRIVGLIAAADIKTATVDADSGAYSAITLNASAAFKKYEFKEDEAEFKQPGSGEKGNYSVKQELTLKFPVMDAASRKAHEEISEASACGVVAVVADPNGNAFVVGYDNVFKGDRPLRLTGSEGTTGKALNDDKGVSITLTCEHTEQAMLFTGDVDALFTASAPA